MKIQMLIHLLVVLIFSPLLFGIIGKTKAFFAGRLGPPLWQPYYDIRKLFRKGNVYSQTTTWIFQAAPLISFATILISSMFVPLGGLKAPFSFWGDILLFISLSALSRFFFVIASWDTGSSFEGMGASREATFSCLAELILFLDFIVLALLSKKLTLSQMLKGDILSSWHLFGPVLLLVGISFFLMLLVENARIPIDDPATHLELTMIHEVMVLDHSGWDLAYIFYGSAIKLFVFAAILINILLPFHSLPPEKQTLLFFGSLILFSFLLGCFESCIARVQLQFVPKLLIGGIVLALAGLLVVSIKRI